METKSTNKETKDRQGDKTPNKNKGHDMGYNTTRADERHLGRGGARTETKLEGGDRRSTGPK